MVQPENRTLVKRTKRLLSVLLATLLLFGGLSIGLTATAADNESPQIQMVSPASAPTEKVGTETLGDDVVFPSQEELLELARHNEILRSIKGEYPAADLPDGDNDGIPDDWEINGVDYDGDGVIDLDLPAMGAKPNVPDVFVEIDWMEGLHGRTCYSYVNGTYKYLSAQDYLDITAQEFKNHGINLHIDFGPDSIDFVTGAPWSSYPDSGGNGNALPFYAEPAWNDLQSGASWYTTQLSPSRRPVFHYFALVENTDVGAGGRAGVTAMYGMVNYTWAFMHELGHNLGLGHGGRPGGVYDPTNYKVNYLSCMNYSISYSFFTYSGWQLPDLDENHLNETAVLDPSGLLDGYVPPVGETINYFYRGTNAAIVNAASLKQPIDYNGTNGATETNLAMDITKDSELTVLKGSKDWDTLTFKNYAIGNTNGTVNTIVYNSSVLGAANMPTTQTKLWSKSIALSSQIPTHPSFTFQGWSTTDGGAVEYAPGSTYSGRDSITLYAVWQLKAGEFTLTLDKNNSNATFSGSSMNATIDGKITLTSTLPVCSHSDRKDFLGWATSAAATKADYLPGQEISLTKNTTLYGVWATPVTIAPNEAVLLSFDYPGQCRWVSFGPGDGKNYTRRVMPSQSLSYQLRVYTGTGGAYSYYAWMYNVLNSTVSTMSTETEYWFRVESAATNPATKWETTFSLTDEVAPAKYIVSYFSNGGTGAPAPQTKTNDINLTLSSAVPTRTGYVFKGWGTTAVAATPSYQPGANYTSNAHLSLYAVWELIVPPVFTSSANTSVFNTVGGTFQATATGTGPITYSLFGAPGGVSINSTTGLIAIAANTPVGSHNFTVMAANAALTVAEQSFTLTINPAPSVAVTSTGLSSLKVGVSISGAVVFTLSNGTYAASIVPANFLVSGLPAGLAAGTAVRTDATHVTVNITGTPTTYSASPKTLTLPGSIPAVNAQGWSGSALVVSGAVTASAVAKGVAPALSWPAAGAITYGQSLSASALTGGSTQYGTFAWTNTSTVPPVPGGSYSVTFTPTNLNYDWATPITNNVSVTVNKASAPTIIWPSAGAITYGQQLSASALTGGSTQYGSFAWTDGSVKPMVANSGYNAVFTPADTANYDWSGVTLTKNLALTVNKATLTVTGGTAPPKTYDGTTAATVTALTFSGLANGETLAFGTDYTVSGTNFNTAAAGTTKTVTGTIALVSNTKTNNYQLSGGSFSLTSKTISPRSITVSAVTATKVYDGTTAFSSTQIDVTGAVFNGKLAADTLTLNKTGVTGTLSGVNAGTSGNLTLSGSFALSGASAVNYTLSAQPTVAAGITKANGTFVAPAALNTTYTPTLKLSGVALPAEYAWVTPTTALSAGSGQIFAAVYTDPSGNYNPVTGNITVNVAKAAGTFPTHAAFNTTYTPTLKLNNLTLNSNYIWVAPTTALSAGNGQSFTATYTDPSGNYNPITGSITVNVAKATPPTLIWPTASALSYGQQLSLSTLAGGSTQYGSFAWADNSLRPSVPGGSYSVTFTPTNMNYNWSASVANNVAVTVNKATTTGTPQTFEVVRNYAKSYSYDLSKLLPSLTAPLTLGAVTYKVKSTVDTSGVLAAAPPNGTASSPLTLNVANVALVDQTAVITITVGSANYADFDVTLTVKTIAKTPVTITGVTMGGKIYDAQPCAYSGTPVVMNNSVPVSGVVLTTLYESTDGGGWSSASAPTNAGAYRLTLSVPTSDPLYSGNAVFTFNVGKKIIIVAADNKTIKEGEPEPVYTFTPTGFVSAPSWDIAPVVSCPTADRNVPYTYTILVSGGNAGSNYALSYQPGTLTVQAKSAACSVTAVTAPTGAVISGQTVSALVPNGISRVAVGLTVSDFASWKLYSDATCTTEIANKTMSLDVGSNIAYVKVTAENGTTKVYTVTVTRAGIAPKITAPAAMSLPTGYAATSTGAFAVSGDPVPEVTKISGDAKITWNNDTKKLDIATELAAGSYSVTLQATNGQGTPAIVTFTLTITNPAALTATITRTNEIFWKRFLNVITLSLACKNYQQVTITPGAGVTSMQYYVGPKNANLSGVTWTNYNGPFYIHPGYFFRLISPKTVYVKLSDGTIISK